MPATEPTSPENVDNPPTSESPTPPTNTNVSPTPPAPPTPSEPSNDSGDRIGKLEGIVAGLVDVVSKLVPNDVTPTKVPWTHIGSKRSES